MLNKICEFIKGKFKMLEAAIGSQINLSPDMFPQDQITHQPSGAPPPSDVLQKTMEARMLAKKGVKVDDWDGPVAALLQRQAAQQQAPQLPQPINNIPFQQPQIPYIPQPPPPQVPNMEFEIMGVKVKIENGKIMKQEWVEADITTHKVVDGKILELQWKEIQK